MSDPTLWVVAGCLFEISLPATASDRWRWTGPALGVTLLAEEVRQSRCHFRFRAEATGAAAEVVVLRFRREEDGSLRSGETEHCATVRIAPERLPEP